MADLISMLAACAGGGEKDPDFNQTVLLLHGDGTNGAQNNTFLDGSTNNFTITRNGNTTQGTFSPFSLAAGEWSNYFDGSGDRLSSSGSVNSAAGTSDFCVEFFVYYTRYPGQFTTIFSTKPNFDGTATGYGIGVENDGTIYNYSNAYITESASGVFSLNTWHHMVFTRSGTTARLFLNGVLRATGTNSQNFSNQAFAIGSHNGTTNSEPMDGYVSNVRFIKGSIPTTYQTSSTTVGDTIFTVPTAPLSTSSQGATSADVEILTCQSNRFVDNSTNAFAITRNGDVRVTPFSPFAPTAAYDAGTNGGSGYFDGSGDYLSVADNVALDISSGDFTVEVWFYTTSSSTTRPLVTRFDGDAATRSELQFRISIVSGNLVITPYSGTTIYDMSFSSIPLNQWNHCALVRTGNNFYAYLNGVRNATTQTISGNLNNGTWETWIGGYREGGAFVYQLGYISNVRILKGTALYTGATYTVPTAPLTAITNTSLLLNFTNAGIIDNTGKNNLETVGDAQIDTTTKKFGTGSLEFDGTGDWLLMPNTPDQQLGTGNFTIEFWVYLASGDTGSARGLVAKGTSTTGWLVSLDSSQKVVFTYTTSTITSTGAITTNAWNHIAVVREGTGSNQTKIYISGTNDGTGTVSTDFNQTSVMYVGANRTGGDAMKGFIDDLRITKGVARYTANFTPPAAAFPNE